MPRTALIYNPLSGSRHHRRQQFIDAIAEIFRDAGHQLTLLPTEHAGHAIALARQAAPFHEVILSAGGDGTAHEILQALVEARSACALGVLPFGTGNVLATNIALPADPVAAARLLLDYKPRRIAAGRIEFTTGSGGRDSSYFTVAAGVGGHAQLIYAANATAKRRGGMIAYYYTGLHSLFTHRFAPMRARIARPDGKTIERTVFEVVAMRVSSFGGMLKNWRPGGALDSGELRLILLTRADRGALFRYALAAFAGRAKESAGIEFHSATGVTCEALDLASPASPIRSQADGEMLGAAPITLSIVSDAFALLMPAR